jgi:N-acetylglutamate synthase-like GNAT family acetyltransferase/NTP pyrophosphatase (non-canonical NTP hydrolase)
MLLRNAHLRDDDVGAARVHFWLAVRDGASVGCIGLELPAQPNGCGLLRSMLVVEHGRGRGIGRRLLNALYAGAQAMGVSRLYCYSTDAGPYWLAHGWAECALTEPQTLLADAPQTALFFKLGWMPAEIAYRKELALPRAHTPDQAMVNQFIDRADLWASAATRLLDVQSELGELSKEMLNITRYGSQPFEATDAWRNELGDLYFSLLALANASGVNLETALGTALLKYRARLKNAGTTGSGH